MNRTLSIDPEAGTYTFSIEPRTWRPGQGPPLVITAPLRFKPEIERHTWHCSHWSVRTSASLRRSSTLQLNHLVWELAGNAPVAQLTFVNGNTFDFRLENLRDRSGPR